MTGAGNLDRRAFDFIRMNDRLPKPRHFGITENVTAWRADVATKIANRLGLEKVLFEAADPEVFHCYIKNYGPEVTLFVGHSQIVELKCLRSAIWGTADLWGRIVTFKG